MNPIKLSAICNKYDILKSYPQYEARIYRSEFDPTSSKIVILSINLGPLSNYSALPKTRFCLKRLRGIIKSDTF